MSHSTEALKQAADQSASPDPGTILLGLLCLLLASIVIGAILVAIQMLRHSARRESRNPSLDITVRGRFIIKTDDSDSEKLGLD